MTDREYLSMEISTTVRSLRESPLRRLVRTGHRVFSAVASEAAAARAERLFLTPPRPRRPAWEVELLARAEARPMRVGARRIETWTWGTGPSVLLVHGWGGRGTQLGAFVAPLVARGFSVVTFDAPGHGASDEGVVTIPEMTAAIHAVAASRGPLAGLVAHSAGALTATAALHEGLNDRRRGVRRPAGRARLRRRPVHGGPGVLAARCASAWASGSPRGSVGPGRPST